MKNPYEESHLEAAKVIRDLSGVEKHDFAIVLGSGWSTSSSNLGNLIFRTQADQIPGFNPSTVPGHSGEISSVEVKSGKRALVIGARTHLYEGKGVQAVVHGVRTAAMCGAEVIILTNGAGGIKESWAPGQIATLSDHINLTGVTPLEGPNFLDLTDLYSRRLRELAHNTGVTLEEGVYVQFRGPNYETPAEVSMARAIGGDMVGMSTSLEAIAARAMGMEVLGLSLITNLAAGVSVQPLSHDEVIEAGVLAGPVTARLLASIANSI